jgi:nucleotide-binding universal stress UspA family protein
VLPLQKLLCPTDFSEASYEALNTAIELASHFHAELCLAHVVPPVPATVADPTFLAHGAEGYANELHADAEKRLAAVIEHRIPPELKARSVISLGDAAPEIVELADTEGVDLIVISTHGLTGWRHLVFGSVAEKVVQLARRPVLVIPASQPKEEN